jgi:hypothetical protein
VPGRLLQPSQVHRDRQQGASRTIHRRRVRGRLRAAGLGNQSVADVVGVVGRLLGIRLGGGLSGGPGVGVGVFVVGVVGETTRAPRVVHEVLEPVEAATLQAARIIRPAQNGQPVDHLDERLRIARVVQPALERQRPVPTMHHLQLIARVLALGRDITIGIEVLDQRLRIPAQHPRAQHPGVLGERALGPVETGHRLPDHADVPRVNLPRPRHGRGHRQPRRQRLAAQRHPGRQVAGLTHQPLRLGLIHIAALLQQPDRTPVTGLLGHPEPLQLSDVLPQPELLGAQSHQTRPGTVEHLPLHHPQHPFAHVFESRTDP